jgi:hypothetical protein
MNYAPVWPLVMAMLRGRYLDFKKRNPVRLTSALLEDAGVSRKQKYKVLKLLEQSDQFLVERFHRQNPLVTMRWILIKD